MCLEFSQYYQIWIGNNVENKLHQLYTLCVIDIIGVFITLFGFIN